MIIERLKALWSLPTLLHNEAHQLQGALERVAQATRMALALKPPSFVLVLLQGHYSHGQPFVAAMSGDVDGGQLRLRYDVSSPMKGLTVLVFCDLRRVRIASMSAGHFPLTTSARTNDATAPMAYHEHELRPGSAVIVELEDRSGVK